ncbi:MAG: hypothetical protein PHU43_02555 [Candidatus Bipolaricaulis sp.]|nr:hypothetical protein [Candidatus Bipolaricaulis sp.]
MNPQLSHKAFEVLRDGEKRSDRQEQPDEAEKETVSPASPKASEMSLVQSFDPACVERVIEFAQRLTK